MAGTPNFRREMPDPDFTLAHPNEAFGEFYRRKTANGNISCASVIAQSEIVVNEARLHRLLKDPL
jgi:hypothetical protein